MGLIKATAAALSGTMEDVWKEMFICNSLPAEVLMVRGVKQVSRRSANTGGDVNTITHGSVICVADGQCAIVVDGGKVVDYCCEPGEYTFQDPKHVPGLGGLLSEVGQRITFGGDPPPRMQRVYYINMKESTDNTFETELPVGLKLLGPEPITGIVSLRGTFSYRIKDPALFYRLLAGNVPGAYTRTELTKQLTSELLTALGPALESLYAGGVYPSQLSESMPELCRCLRESLSRGWAGEHGLEIASIAIGVIAPPDMTGMTRMQAAAGLLGTAAPGEGKKEARGEWTCVCGGKSTGAFCPRCGRARKWTCSCGRENLGRFCEECGKARP